VKASFGEGYGGVITFISKKSVPQESSILDTTLAVGRAQRVTILGDDDCKLVIYNVHNFGIQGLTMSALCNAVDSDVRDSKADPLKFSLFLAGDLNLTPPHSKLFEYKSPSPTSDNAAAAARPSGGQLELTLEQLIEFEATTPTRYQTETNSAVVLDRIFGTLPATILTKCRVSHTVEQDPRDLFKSGISDHAPVVVTIAFRAPLPPGEGAIPSEIFRHKMYSYFLERLCWEEKFDSLTFDDSFTQLEYFKNLMKAAANYTRDHLQTHNEDSPLVLSQSYSAIARAVWMQSVPLAETLLLRSNIARQFIEIKGDKVCLKDPAHFSEAADSANTSLLESRGKAVMSQPHGKSRDSRAQRITNLAKLWLPLSKRFVISGIKVDSNIIRSEPALSIATGTAWQPTFNPKAFDEQAAERFLQTLGNIGEYSHTPPPDLWVYDRTIFSMSDSMPGKDGLPYSAWRGASVRGIRCLMDADLELRRGIFPPPSFNESSILFAPKGSQPHDPVEVIREPLQTRPLSLKNSDNKLIVSSNVKSLEPQYQLITHKTQNGFVAGRNFLNNILDLDSAARIFSMVYESECDNNNPSNIPILGAFDYEAAFPSVIHGWIWLVLRYRKLPNDYINLFKGIYHKASATFSHGQLKFTLIAFLSGVLQGCPGSAFLFNNGLDPFLYLMYNKLREANRGIGRACADDIGVCLARLKHLQLLYPIFHSAQELAGLKLKPVKCVLVPLCDLSENVRRTYLSGLGATSQNGQTLVLKTLLSSWAFTLGQVQVERIGLNRPVRYAPESNPFNMQLPL